MIDLREFPGYHGLFTRKHAKEAIPNGARVMKIASTPKDTHQDGCLATILGSIFHPTLGFGYFVEWDDLPRHAVFIAGHRCKAI